MDGNKIGIVGDWHGNDLWAISQIEQLAKEHKVANIIQLGDFGLFPTHDSVDFMDRVNALLRQRRIKLYAVRGNHDSDEWEYRLKTGPYDYKNSMGAYIRSNIVLLPRTGIFMLGRTEQHPFRIAVAGGGVSIDRHHRELGKSYWLEEQLTDAEVDEFKPRHGVEMLVTHDCSDTTPWGFNLVPDPLSQQHRQRIDRVIANVAPDFHFHGHMHRRYEWDKPIRDGDSMKWVQTFGLDCDGGRWSSGVFDTKAQEFTWVDNWS